jgi:hypothetical protein
MSVHFQETKRSYRPIVAFYKGALLYREHDEIAYHFFGTLQIHLVERSAAAFFSSVRGMPIRFRLWFVAVMPVFA